MTDIPNKIKTYFWGDDLSELDWEKHKDYITQTIMEKGDREAIRWLLERTDKSYLQKVIQEKHLEPKSANFWTIYLS